MNFQKFSLNHRCIEWTGTRNDYGHGVVTLDNKTYKVHRWVWENFVGPIPEGKPTMWVLHKCDNPPCANPYHLYLGTPSDNQIDRFSKRWNPEKWIKRTPPMFIEMLSNDGAENLTENRFSGKIAP